MPVGSAKIDRSVAHRKATDFRPEVRPCLAHQGLRGIQFTFSGNAPQEPCSRGGTVVLQADVIENLVEMPLRRLCALDPAHKFSPLGPRGQVVRDHA